MKILLLICALVAVALARPSVRNDAEPIVRDVFETRLDHFTPQDSRKVTFQFAYNPSFAHDHGPIFVLINNGEVDGDQWLYQSLMHSIASDVNATLLTFNTRYFGANNVTNDASTNNLRYLTVEQTLADIAVFLTVIRDEYKFSSGRIILAGSGFGGTLATWARQRYPHLVYATWASSGIFQRSQHTAEPYEYLSQIIREHGSDQCAQSVFDAFELVQEHLEHFDIFYIEELFNLCIFVLPYDSDEMAMFYSGLIDYIVQYFNENHLLGVEEFCNAMSANATTPKDQLFAQWVLKHYNDDECLDYDYYSRVTKLRRTEWDAPITQSGVRQHLYWQCTQLATHPTTVNGDTLFGRLIAQDYYLNLCSDVFGSFDYASSQVALEHLLLQYGTTDPGTTRNIFSNGQLDNFYNLGITEDDDEPDTFVITIPNSARSADFWQFNDHDTTDIAAAKYAVHEIIVKWATQD